MLFDGGEATLASIEELVSTLRQLARLNPGAVLPKLVRGLEALGVKLGELGRHSAALASFQETVALSRSLMESFPSDGYLPLLAQNLYNLGVQQSQMNLREESLDSMQEAVRHYRKLADDQPSVFQPDLAESLFNLSVLQSEMRNMKAALASAEEALDTVWPNFMNQPHAFMHVTGTILHAIAAFLVELGLPVGSELRDRWAVFRSRAGI
jgi:tetratricopeptide (TPR) repeat protein